jgi:hypothetical protein
MIFLQRTYFTLEYHQIPSQEKSMKVHPFINRNPGKILCAFLLMEFIRFPGQNNFDCLFMDEIKH